ncbi:hypothetical protein EVAR_62106_1, partial [Eumeta japonica]
IDTNEIQNEVIQKNDTTRLTRQKRFFEEEQNTTPHESTKVYRVTDESGLEIVVHLHNTSNDAENTPFQLVHVSEHGRCDICDKKNNRRENCAKCCCSKCCKCDSCCRCNTCNKCTNCSEAITEATESIVIEKSAPVEICISVMKNNNTNCNEICKCLKCKNCKNKCDSESVVVLKVKSPKSSQSCDLIPSNSLWDESRKKEANALLNAKTSTMSPGIFLLHLNSNKTTTRKTLENELFPIQFKTVTAAYKIPPLPQFISSSAKKERTPHLCNSEKMSLNREFLNAINRQLLEIYKNLTSIQSQIRKTRNISNILDKIQARNSKRLNKEKYRKRRKICSEEGESKRSSFVPSDQIEPSPNYDFDKLNIIYDSGSEENFKNYNKKREKNMLIVKRNASGNDTRITIGKERKSNDTNQLTTSPTTPCNTLITVAKETKSRKEIKTEDQSGINTNTIDIDDKEQTNNDSFSLHEDNLQELDNFTDGIQRLMDLIGCLSGVIVEEKKFNSTSKEEKRNGNYTGPPKITHEPISTTTKLTTIHKKSTTEEDKKKLNQSTDALTSTSSGIATTMGMASVITKVNKNTEINENTTYQSWKTHNSDDRATGITRGPTIAEEVRSTIVKSNNDSKGDQHNNESHYISSKETTVGTKTVLENPSTSAITSEQNRSEPKSQTRVLLSTVIPYDKVTKHFDDSKKAISNANTTTKPKERKTHVKNKKRKDGMERSTKDKEYILHTTHTYKEQEKAYMFASTTLSSSLHVNTLPTTPSVFSKPDTTNNYNNEEFKTPDLLEWKIVNYNSPMQTYPEDNSTIYRNLLNSVFRYEMNLLKEEWESFLNRERGYDADIQRNIKDKGAVLFSSTERPYIQVIMPRLEQPTSTKRSLFHKLASKISRQHPRDVSKKREKYLILKSRSLNVKKTRREETTTKKCKTKLYKLTKPHTTGNAESTTKGGDKVTTDRVTTDKNSTGETTRESTTNKAKTETEDDDEEQEEETSETPSTESTSESSTESKPPESVTETTSAKTVSETSTATTTTTVKSSKDKPSHPIVIDQSGPPATESTTHPLPDPDEDKNSKEACDPDNPNLSCMCDMRATHHRILESYKKMSARDFERYVRNVTCHRYKYAPDHFLLREYADPYKQHYRDVENYIHRKVHPKKLGKRGKLDDQGRWDWIRSRRSLQSFDYFETYTRSKGGVYERTCEGARRKRAPDVSALGAGLRDLPDFNSDKVSDTRRDTTPDRR